MLPKRSSKFSKKSFLNLTQYFKYLKYFILVPAIIILLEVFKIKTVSCVSGGGGCDTEIVEKLSSYKNTSIFTFNQKKLYESLNRLRPLESLDTHFKLFNVLQVSVNYKNSFIPINLKLVSDYPPLSINSNQVSTLSAIFFEKPSIELNSSVDLSEFNSFNLYESGLLVPIASQSSNIYFLLKQKPTDKIMSEIYKILEIIGKYLSAEKIYILGDTVFLSRSEQPDIITSVPYDEDKLLEALQSLGFLNTMKKDPKIIDLRYKNPIIR